MFTVEIFVFDLVCKLINISNAESYMWIATHQIQFLVGNCNAPSRGFYSLRYRRLLHLSEKNDELFIISRELKFTVLSSRFFSCLYINASIRPHCECMP